MDQPHGVIWLSGLRVTALGILVLAGCGNLPTADSDGRVYHCVELTQPIPPPNTWAKKVPVERFEYGDYGRQSTPTVGGSGYCATIRVPQTAYFRYQLDGQTLEKRFDLSALTPQRVHRNTVEFHVDGQKVEVRLVTPVAGTWPKKEVIARQ